KRRTYLVLGRVLIVRVKNKEIITKKYKIILGAILAVCLIFYINYNKWISYFGFVDIRELKHVDDQYTVTVEADFGVKTSVVKESDTFTVYENERPTEGNITMIWDRLDEGETYHVSMKTYEKRDNFELKSIYMD